MSIQDTLQVAFDAANERNPDAIMACWSDTGTYDNPMTGTPATGYDALRERMVNLVEGLAKTGATLIVDRVTVGETNVVAEWHVEPPDGRRGVHVAGFDEDGKLKRVTVYPRAS
jgi:hypothetical protein